MTAVPREQPEPVDRFAPGTGSGLSAILAVAVPRVLAWAGPGLRALLLSGSHATGEAAWAEHQGRALSLSDLDLYAVMRDEASARAAAHARDREQGGATAAALRGAGLAGPLEVAFVTREGLAHMPARPGTVELARSARVIAGDAGEFARLPRWSPAGIGAEERLLLLENRAFELLWARLARGPDLDGLRARHAVLKTALELASARTLMAGELPGMFAERVARARTLGPPAAIPEAFVGAWAGLERAWRTALASRERPLAAVSEGEVGREWNEVARAWAALWWAETAGASVEADPWARALVLARRGPLARRLRRALAPHPGAGAAADRAGFGGLAARLAHATAGTPRLRLHGVAVVLVLASADARDEPALPRGALRSLRRLGLAPVTSFTEAARLAAAAWGRPVPASRAEGSRA